MQRVADVSKSKMSWPQDHPVLVHFLLSLAISWAGWIPDGASQAGLISWKVPTEISMFSQYGPFIAALILSAREGGWGGVRDLLGRFVRWRVGLQWYVFVLLIPPAVGASVLGVHTLAAGTRPHFEYLADWYVRNAAAIRTGGWNVLEKTPLPSFGLIAWLADVAARGPFPCLLVWAAMAIGNGGISEEPGWRGYELPRLQARRSALGASLYLGLLWGLWHTGPDFWKLIFEGRLLAVVLPIGTIFGTLPLAVLFTCVFNNTGGSLLLCILFHAAINSTYNLLSLLAPDFPFTIRYMEFSTLYAVIAVILVLVFGRDRLRRGVAS